MLSLKNSGPKDNCLFITSYFVFYARDPHVPSNHTSVLVESGGFFINCVTFKRTYKMSRLISFLLIIFFFSRSTYGMDCNFGNSKNIIDEIVGTCPRPLLDSTDKSYCCIDIKNDKFYCCDAEEFALKTGLGIVVPAIIATVVILLLIISCISCLCCSCCPWYRRRHRGTVYGSKAGN